MAEEILDDNLRNDILKQVFTPPTKKVEEVKTTPIPIDINEIKPKTFGELLEETVAKREKMDKEVNIDTDNIREQVLKNSRLDLIGQFKF